MSESCKIYFYKCVLNANKTCDIYNSTKYEVQI